MSSDELTTLPNLDALSAQVLSLQHENAHLKLLVAKLQRMQFGRRAEILPANSDQLALLLTEEKTQNPALPKFLTQEKTTLKHHPVRKPLPAHLPCEIEQLLPDAQCCPDCASPLRLIGEDVSEQLEYVPARFKVIRHVRPKLACSAGCDVLLQAPVPDKPIARGIAGPGLLSHVLISKYCDHLPLYRQSQIYAREGVELPRSTLADWVRQSSQLLSPLVDAIRRHTLAGNTVHADDTPVPVLAPGHGKTRTARFWTYVRDERPHGSDSAPAVWFAYTPDRKGIHPQQHLADFNGVIHADGYAGFNKLFDGEQRQEAACWAHVRRKFYDLHIDQQNPRATQALEYIRQLYRIESAIKGQPPDRRRAYRQLHARTVHEAFYAWMNATIVQISRKSALGSVIYYALARWQALTRYCDDGRIEIDNNAAERALRGVALGRKNYLFVGSDRGGEHAAALYTLIGSAHLNGINPQRYLCDVLSNIASHPINKIDELLPWNINAGEELTNSTQQVA